MEKVTQQPVKKRYDLLIEEEGQTVTKSIELDKTIKSILGVLVTSDRDDLLFYRGTQKIEINKEEFFPENYESKLLMSGINVQPNMRYYNLGKVPAGSGQVKVVYTDSRNPLSTFAAYRVSVYLLCEVA
jgi:hypothetical protein